VGHVPWWGTPRVTLHRVLTHMIAETHRHAGHADIVRELIDGTAGMRGRSEEHTSELQSRENLVCRLLLEKKKVTQCAADDLARRCRHFAPWPRLVRLQRPRPPAGLPSFPTRRSSDLSATCRGGARRASPCTGCSRT